VLCNLFQSGFQRVFIPVQMCVSVNQHVLPSSNIYKT
jgi:hypothetical protein